ncbi:hypothetical protein PF004_g11575 [Phytophthora fragariae]|uniref:Uncharacterized protein n=1 Tax=Phytophthora fragariae TaxID=53985 RepID=A0A6G0NXM1_9STRA|nr:hypothetical protein PF004_g11575 [Phytophthora fragariae]
MSTPTTQTSDAPAASAAGNAVVATSATTATSSASSASVVTSTVTTSSSPKRTISVGEYQKTRSKAVYARESLFDGIHDVDMEEGEEEKESSSSGRDEASVGTRRPREDDSDASSSKRSRSGSDRPLADAGSLFTPRDGDDDDSTPSAAVTSRTNPVRAPWMPSPSAWLAGCRSSPNTTSSSTTSRARTTSSPMHCLGDLIMILGLCWVVKGLTTKMKMTTIVLCASRQAST